MWQAVNLICRYYLSTMHYFNSSTCLYLLKTRVRPEWLRYPSALLTTAAKSPTPETAQCRKQHRNAISKHQNSNKINQRPVECTQLFYWKSKLWKIIIKSFHPELVLLHSKKKEKKKKKAWYQPFFYNYQKSSSAAQVYAGSAGMYDAMQDDILKHYCMSCLYPH